MPLISPAALSDARLAAAYLIFIASYLVFALGKFPGLKIDRPGAAIIGAVAMVAARIVQPREALRFIDFSTLVLLFSMMLIVGNLHLVGFFEWNAEVVLRRLKPAYLLPAVIFTCGFLSAFFVNDIVCLVMVPFVLEITRRMRLQPLPYLLAVATASNIGSVATITGNPQNMLIGSFSGIRYREFLWHLGPIAFIGLFLDWAVLHWIHLRHVVHLPTEDTTIPLPALDLSRLTKPAIVVTAVVIGFFLGVPPAMMAALGAAMLLITRTLEPQKLYKEVDWGLLVFFVGLFLIVGGAENAGIVQALLDFAQRWNLQRLGVFTVAVGLLSNLVSNVPAVMLLKSLVPGFADPRTAWLALAMASTLAGNLTITGSVANIIVVETAKPEVEISFRDYLRAGVPITVATLLVGWLWLATVK
ncbi:MAG TPA: anion transporter [Terriglobales bacterium]|jgi:Na+/H+ antiporter NhaD/arsenite permease-like protein|nr:anion transporter [Terriglobales bacterium]